MMRLYCEKSIQTVSARPGVPDRWEAVFHGVEERTFPIKGTLVTESRDVRYELRGTGDCPHRMASVIDVEPDPRVQQHHQFGAESGVMTYTVERIAEAVEPDWASPFVNP